MASYSEAVLAWQRRRIRTDAGLSAAMEGQGIHLAYHSGKIENDRITYNDTREIFNHDSVVNYTGDLRTLFEIRNARDAFEYFFVSFHDRHPLNEEFLKEMQRLLTQNTYDIRHWQIGERPGEYKKHAYVTGKNEVGAHPEDVSGEISKLLAEVQAVSQEQALTTAAYFHAKFESIHPFADGNGRTGRLAMNYLLVLLDHPPIIIHEEDRYSYYTALESWDSEQKLGPMVEFLKAQTVKTWAKQIEREDR